MSVQPGQPARHGCPRRGRVYRALRFVPRVQQAGAPCLLASPMPAEQRRERMRLCVDQPRKHEHAVLGHQRPKTSGCSLHERGEQCGRSRRGRRIAARTRKRNRTTYSLLKNMQLVELALLLARRCRPSREIGQRDIQLVSRSNRSNRGNARYPISAIAAVRSKCARGPGHLTEPHRY